MLTEEQIQRLTKIAVVETLGYEEKEAEKKVEKVFRIAVTIANFVHDFFALFGYEETMEKIKRFFDEEAFIRRLRILKKENKEQIQA